MLYKFTISILFLSLSHMAIDQDYTEIFIANGQKFFSTLYSKKKRSDLGNNVGEVSTISNKINGEKKFLFDMGILKGIYHTKKKDFLIESIVCIYCECDCY